MNSERLAAGLLSALDGNPYYGPSLLGAIGNVSAASAAEKPSPGLHSIWELVLHVTAELRYSEALLGGTAGPWVAGQTTWPKGADQSAVAWDNALKDLTDATDSLVTAVRALDYTLLDQPLKELPVTHYEMLAGTIQHQAYHAGQIAVLKRLRAD